MRSGEIRARRGGHHGELAFYCKCKKLVKCLKQESENGEMSKGETLGARVQVVASLRCREVEQFGGRIHWTY